MLDMLTPSIVITASIIVGLIFHAGKAYGLRIRRANLQKWEETLFKLVDQNKKCRAGLLQREEFLKSAWQDLERASGQLEILAKDLQAKEHQQ